MQEKEEKKLAPARDVLRLYTRYVLSYPWLSLAVVLCGLVIQTASVITPVFLSRFFNTLSVQTPSQAAGLALIAILVLIAVLWIVDWAFRRLQDVANIFLSSRIMVRLYGDAFEYLMGHSYNFFISNFAGTLTHRLSRYARSFENIYDMIFIQFYPTFLYMAGAIVILYLRHPLLGLSLLAWSILFVCFQIYTAKLREPVRKVRAEADAKITATAADAIANHPTVVQFSGTQFERASFVNVVEGWRRATLRSWLWETAMWGGIGLLVLVIDFALFYGGIVLWERGSISLGDFVLIQSFLIGTFNSLMGISYQLRRFNDSFADAGEMVYVLKQPHEVIDVNDADVLKIATGVIDFRDVSFNFSDRVVLNNLNLAINGGEKVALVGPSGAGKSTITKLLLRLYDLKDGSISIDGQNIASVAQDTLREAIAFVPQEPILFHRTLMENIRYGKRDTTDAQVFEAAKQAHCHEFITSLPEGYNTYVGERGIKLSGGERQRVAIARALLKNAPILVLDEATSSLDSESEALIQDALETLMRGKTVIVIAHRLSTIMKMDRIIVLQEGRVVASGTHRELLEKDGLYKKLWNIQVGGFLADDEDTLEIKKDEESELAQEPEEE